MSWRTRSHSSQLEEYRYSYKPWRYVIPYSPCSEDEISYNPTPRNTLRTFSSLSDEHTIAFHLFILWILLTRRNETPFRARLSSLLLNIISHNTCLRYFLSRSRFWEMMFNMTIAFLNIGKIHVDTVFVSALSDPPFTSLHYICLTIVDK